VSDEFKVQVSLTAPPPAQYAKGAMVNFRGDTVDEVVGLLQDAQASELLELASDVEKVWLVKSQLNASEVSSSGQGATVTQGNFGGNQQAAPAPSCQHGPRVWKSGKGRTGDWYAWFCSAPKGQGCDAVWANADGSVKD
jgi:hypothetical protein